MSIFRKSAAVQASNFGKTAERSRFPEERFLCPDAGGQSGADLE